MKLKEVDSIPIMGQRTIKIWVLLILTYFQKLKVNHQITASLILQKETLYSLVKLT